MKHEMSIEDNFYGAATVGERGQVVIPAEARKKFGIQPGDKLLVIGHPAGSGIMLCKIDEMRDFFAAMLEDLKRIESKVEDSDIEKVA
ncbi:MAG: AbrB/MazE/SpoVT family DNA-binding domain-containing protein [Armatimonadetes bacterium]|nr:AbrB/MazE/SpoVT family DNA-binding domain-containing protein [Armatimonadota bacterium]